MIELYKEGIVPHIQVHDELDISGICLHLKNMLIQVENFLSKKTCIKKNIMEGAVNKISKKRGTRNKVDYESGPNWGNIK